jgi:hypothetical protein
MQTRVEKEGTGIIILDVPLPTLHTLALPLPPLSSFSLFVPTPNSVQYLS